MVLLQIILIYYIFLERQWQCTILGHYPSASPSSNHHQGSSISTSIFINIENIHRRFLLINHPMMKILRIAIPISNELIRFNACQLQCLSKLQKSKQHHRHHQSNTIPTTGFIICKYLENGKYALCPGHGYLSHNGDSVENRTHLKTWYHSCSIQILQCSQLKFVTSHKRYTSIKIYIVPTVQCSEYR